MKLLSRFSLSFNLYGNRIVNIDKIIFEKKKNIRNSKIRGLLIEISKSIRFKSGIGNLGDSKREWDSLSHDGEGIRIKSARKNPFECR